MKLKRIAVIQKCEQTGDFEINYAFGQTKHIKKDTEDWEDIDDFLKFHSPNECYEIEEVKDGSSAA